ncbi:MAG: Gfo/Idh/MocA family protein [Planctomycetota bacterium]|jgi:predicted dehydrogenase
MSGRAGARSGAAGGKTDAGPIRVGIAGLGRAGWGMQVKELEKKPDKFRIVAGCDPEEEFRDRLAGAFGCRTYVTVDELLADPEVELVSIATRSVDHCAHTTAALKTGRHVVLEKPIATTYAEARKIKSAAARASAKLLIRHNRRFDPDFLHVREIIASGVLGEVYEVKLSRISYQRRNDWQTLLGCGGGQLLNWGPHIIDHGLRFLDAPVAEIWSDLKRIAAVGDAEDHLKIVLKGANGRIVDIEISGGGAVPMPTFLVWGTKGGLTVEEDSIRLRYLDPESGLAPREADAGTPRFGFAGSPDELGWIEKTVPVGPREQPDIWDEVYKAVREGAAYPITVDQAVEVMRVVSEVKKGTPFEMKAKKKPKSRKSKKR